MAEILLKIGDGANYADGDVLCAFNRRRTRCVHAQHFCHPKHAPRNAGGLIRLDALARDFYEATHEYRFARRSPREVARIRIATGEEHVFGPTPTVVDGKRQHVDVRAFVARRRRHPRHRIFGEDGQEVWYGGRMDLSDAALDVVWAAIESKTGRLESEELHTLYPLGRADIRSHLAVRVEDFTDEEADALVAPQYERDADGNIVTDEDDKPIKLAKRNIRVDWRAELLDDLGVSEADVLDRSVPVGREVQVDPGAFRYHSKDQPTQASRSKLFDKSRGGRVPEPG